MRTRMAVVIGAAALLLLGLSLSAACSQIPLTSQEPQHDDTTILLDTVEEAWDQLSQNYVDRSQLDPEKLSEGAIRGMLEALDDPYTSYLNAHGYEAEILGLEGRYQGIGAYVGFREDRIVIIAPIPGSPAEEAGIRPGDSILEVDGETIDGLSLAEAVQRIRGPAGTTVTLTVLHEGEEEPAHVLIVRSEIQLKTVVWEMRDDIAYVQIAHFLQPTADEFDSVMTEANGAEGGIAGIILDLRNNPGGLLDSVVDIASHFVEDGVVTYVVDSEGERSFLQASPHKIKVKLPIVVLVNKFSASGSEVLSGALRDHGLAILAGERTFGKGSVNIFRPLSNGGALYITTSRWLTPDGTLIEGQGLEPDFITELQDDELVDWAIRYLHGEELCPP